VPRRIGSSGYDDGFGWDLQIDDQGPYRERLPAWVWDDVRRCVPAELRVALTALPIRGRLSCHAAF